MSALAQNLRWWNARDRFLGRNMQMLDLCEGLALAQKCDHPEGAWLVSLFPGGAPQTLGEARAALLAHAKDPRALAFAAALGAVGSHAMLLRAASAGYPFAQSEYAARLFGVERVAWAEKAAKNGDASGMCILAQCLSEGNGCEKDQNRAQQLWHRAALLNDVIAQHNVAKVMFGPGDHRRYNWLCRAAAGGYYHSIFETVWEAEQMAAAAPRNTRALFAIGAGAQRQVDQTHMTVFGRRFLAFPGVLVALEVYEETCSKAREGLESWTGVARRLGVSRDVRRIVSKLLWDGRDEWAQ
jgi:hypothetical protein